MMAEESERVRWDHTADLLAQLDNCAAFRDQGRRPARREHYHPLPLPSKPAEPAQETDPKLFVRALGAAFGCTVPPP